ncbi:MAG: acyl-CoA dehydrogenase [Frankiales bacterium]|nr:acyl-CoA dehydrogenase [Frankiales bacterium]
MEFGWSEEQSALREQAVRFGREMLDGGVLEDDLSGRFPAEKWRLLADWGYFGLAVPEELGGPGLDPMTGLLVTEGLAEGCQDFGLLFSASVQAWVVIGALLRFGTEDQLDRHLPGLADGTTVGALAITEPDCGSDALSLRTTAREVHGGWLLRGRKAYVTNAPIADLVLCFASSGATQLLGGMSAFLVETSREGVHRGSVEPKMGLRTSPLGELGLDDVFVPTGELLGKLGRGVAVFHDAMAWERTWLTALQVGTLQRQLDETRAYACERRAFGIPIAGHQSVAHRIVDMHLRLECGRLLVYRAAAAIAAGRPAGTEAALAKLWMSESALASSLDSLQVHGGNGYLSCSGVERQVRDAAGGQIYSGTSEMMRNLVADSLGLHARPTTVAVE